MLTNAILLAALILVESNGNDLARGKHGEVGCLQIRQCVLDDVNRVHGTKFKLADCTSRLTSIHVMELYLQIWLPVYTRKTGLQPTPEIIARIWNGGPNGWKRAATSEYWALVSRTMTNIT